MNRFTLILFRFLLIIGGCILLYIIGRPAIETIQYRLQGNIVSGKVIGFRGSGSSKTVFDDNTAKKGKRYRSRRPVFRYPKSLGSLDSLDGYANSTIILPWLNFQMGEVVTVVMHKEDPNRSHIYSVGVLFTDFLLALLSIFMMILGVYRIKS